MIQKLSAQGHFEPEFLEYARELFEEKIVFNRVIGLKLTDLGATEAHASLAMTPDLVGHFAYNRLHGGVIGTALDAIGGMACMAAIAARHMDEAPAKRMERFMKLGTIDLRIDYLRPGIGTHFTLRGEVLRLGSRVGSTRMEFFGSDGKLLATGSGAYIVS